MLAPTDLWRSWSFEPGVIALLAISGAVYARGARGARLRGSRVAAFVAGWLALVVALVSPLDGLGETLFAAHMVQHLLLMVVAAPLLVLGMPPATALWALPRGQRLAAARWWTSSPRTRRLIGWPLNPAIVVALQTVALWFWHFPRPYQAALANDWVHALEHASFLGTSLLFWWIVLHPTGRRTLGFGAGILYIGVTICQSGALGALLMLSSHAWYPVHAAGERLWSITPLEDQQIAGLIMWIPGGAVYLAAGATLFIQWIRAEERTMRIVEGAGVVAVIVCLFGAACTKSEPPTQFKIANSDPARGRVAIERFGCGSCHDIPGIHGAVGMVGPPLTHWSQRRTIAGEMENTPDHLITWITMPQAVEPGTAMPNMGISDGEARDIAAYLYSIR